MNVIDVIKRDHRAAEALFTAFRQAGSDEERNEVAEEIFSALTTHESMEDSYFYPALENDAKENEIVAELEREQADLKTELDRIASMDVGEERERALLAAMEKVLKHARKEESALLPLAEQSLGQEELDELGSETEPQSAVAHASR